MKVNTNANVNANLPSASIHGLIDVNANAIAMELTLIFTCLHKFLAGNTSGIRMSHTSYRIPYK